jgi:hypothetical protein
MNAPHYIARPWQCHAATSVGYEADGKFMQVAECSGFGNTSEDAEQMAAQIAAALNSMVTLDDEWTALDTHFASEVAGIRALPKPVTWTELHKFADAVAKRASSAIRAENARLRAILDARREQEK